MSRICALGCPPRTRSKVSHRFPQPEKYPMQCEEWCKVVPAWYMQLKNFTKEDLIKKARICDKHFQAEEKYTSTKRIHRMVLPVLCLYGQPSTHNNCNCDRDFIGLPDIVNIKTPVEKIHDIEYEHNYISTVLEAKQETDHDYHSNPQKGEKSLDCVVPDSREAMCIKLSNIDVDFGKIGEPTETENVTNSASILEEITVARNHYINEASKQDNDTESNATIQQPESFAEENSDTLKLEQINNEDYTSNTRCGSPTPELGNTTVVTGILVSNEVQSVEDPLAIDSLDTAIEEEINEEDGMGIMERSVGIDEASMGSLEDSSYTERDSVAFSGDEECEMERSIPDNDLDNRIEIAFALKFIFKQGKPTKQALQEIMKVYGHVISMKEIECWYNEFKLENSIMRIIYSGGPVYK